MENETPYRRKRLCSHEMQCKQFVVMFTASGLITLCRADAIIASQLTFDKLQVLPKLVVKTQGWTVQQITLLVNFISLNEIRRGTVISLAEELGKSPKQVKDKMRYLRNKGAFIQAKGD